MANESSTSGIGFGSLLTLLFIGLKITHYIDWQWKWVLAPLWLPFVLFLLFMLVVVVLKIAVSY